MIDSAHCSVAFQKELQTRSSELPEDRRMAFRIGFKLGDRNETVDRKDKETTKRNILKTLKKTKLEIMGVR